MSQTRAEWLAEKLREFEQWADRVKAEELRVHGRSEEMVNFLDDDPDVDRLIAEARSTALQQRGSA